MVAYVPDEAAEIQAQVLLEHQAGQPLGPRKLLGADPVPVRGTSQAVWVETCGTRRGNLFVVTSSEQFVVNSCQVDRISSEGSFEVFVL